MALNFVIVSFDVNFWPMAALDCLIESIELSKEKSKVYVIHNYKTNEQIDHFSDYFKNKISEYVEIEYIVAYEDMLSQITNYRHTHFWGITKIMDHPSVLCWLIKYRLPIDSYLFIDQDCLVNDSFVSNYAKNNYPLIKDKYWVFPDHSGASEYLSLTAPMFFCNTGIRKYFLELCDFAWCRALVGNAVFGLNNGKGPEYITNFPIEKEINRPPAKPYFDVGFRDDSLYSPLRHLLTNNKELFEEDKISIRFWGYNEHLWQSGAIYGFDEHKIKMLKNYIFPRFKAEYFKKDLNQNSIWQFGSILRKFTQNLRQDMDLCDYFCSNFLGSKDLRKEKVFITIPTYKRYEQLRTLLQDIVIQTYRNIDVYICSDGPDDKVREIVDEFNSESNDIKCFYNELEKQNGYWGHPARRHLLNIIEGEGSVVFINDDNRIYPDYINKLVSLMDSTVDITYCLIKMNGWPECKSIIPGGLRFGENHQNHISPDNIDAMNFMVRLSLAKKFIDCWNNKYEADFNFISNCNRAAIGVDSCVEVLGEHN